MSRPQGVQQRLVDLQINPTEIWHVIQINHDRGRLCKWQSFECTCSPKAADLHYAHLPASTADGSLAIETTTREKYKRASSWSLVSASSSVVTTKAWQLLQHLQPTPLSGQNSNRLSSPSSTGWGAWQQPSRLPPCKSYKSTNTAHMRTRDLMENKVSYWMFRQ